MPVKKEVLKVKKVSKVAEKKAVSLEAKVEVKKPAKETTTKQVKELSIPIYSLSGTAAGTLTLPEEIFGAKVNKNLLAQAMRVYLTNKQMLGGNTKTRGEVEGSTAKIFKQKGTGRARHGGIRAPIFVGGGIAFGPKPRKVRLGLPQRMKKVALVSALSSKAEEKQILAISGLEDATGKTKEIVTWLNKFQADNALIVTGQQLENIVKATKNVPSVDISPVNLINAYEILRHNFLILTKDAVEKLK